MMLSICCRRVMVIVSVLFFASRVFGLTPDEYRFHKRLVYPNARLAELTNFPLLVMLDSTTPHLATGAADVLALLSSEEAQRAIADESLDTAKSTEVRVSLLNSLAQSIKTHGNFLLEPQVNDIGNLVAPEDAELMESAAAVMGALGVTSGPQAVEHIVNPKQEAPDSP